MNAQASSSFSIDIDIYKKGVIVIFDFRLMKTVTYQSSTRIIIILL